MQELRVEISIPLPTDTFDEAALLVKLRPVLDQFRQELATAAEPTTIAMSVDVVTPRPRATKADAAPRKTRAPKANGAGAQAPAGD